MKETLPLELSKYVSLVEAAKFDSTLHVERFCGWFGVFYGE